MTTADQLAAALRRVIDKGAGGKDWTGHADAAQATRDGIVALAAYEAERDEETRALREAEAALRDHPDAGRGNSKVHFALHRIRAELAARGGRHD